MMSLPVYYPLNPLMSQLSKNVSEPIKLEPDESGVYRVPPESEHLVEQTLPKPGCGGGKEEKRQQEQLYYQQVMWEAADLAHLQLQQAIYEKHEASQFAQTANVFLTGIGKLRKRSDY